MKTVLGTMHNTYHTMSHSGQESAIISMVFSSSYHFKLHMVKVAVRCYKDPNYSIELTMGKIYRDNHRN